MFTLDQGATTFWERWNSYSKENGFGDVSMNSFNHYSFGVVAEWMYSYMAGIMYDMSRPGFKHIILQPLADASNNITFVDGSYDSAYGLIESGWDMTDGNLSYSAVIPANTSATLYLPADGQSAGIDGAAAAGVKYIGAEEHNGVKTAKFELVSGGYDFVVSDDKITVTLKDEYVSSDIVYGLYANGEEIEYIPASGDAVFKARLSINTEKPVSLICRLR